MAVNLKSKQFILGKHFCNPNSERAGTEKKQKKLQTAYFINEDKSIGLNQKQVYKSELEIK